MYVILFIAIFLLICLAFVMFNTKEVDKKNPENIQLLLDIKSQLIKRKLM